MQGSDWLNFLEWYHSLASSKLGKFIFTTRGGGSPSIFSHCLARIINLLLKIATVQEIYAVYLAY